MFSLKDIFKPREATTEQEKQEPLSVEQQALELQRQQLELQQRQFAEANPDYAFEQDAKKHLTADAVIDKFGLPVTDGETDEIKGFVPKVAMDHLLTTQFDPKLKQMETFQEASYQRMQQEEFYNRTLPQFRNQMLEHHGHFLAKYPDMNERDWEQLLYIIAEPEVSNALNQASRKGDAGLEAKAVKYALDKFELNKRYQLGSIPMDDGSEVPGSVADKRYDGQVSKDEELPSELPLIHAILIDDKPERLKADTPENLELADYFIRLTKKYDELEEKTGQRSYVKHATKDELQRLVQKYGIKNVKVDRSLVSS